MSSQNIALPRFRAPLITFLALIALAVLSSAFASLVQADFGRLEVTNEGFRNEAGRFIRAKLLLPAGAEAAKSLPGIVYIHGYQNNRETSDPYCIELARRGFAVVEIDALGRGNSDAPGDLGVLGFDPSYGGKAALSWLRAQPFVDPARVGMMGHSLGAEMAYRMALEDASIPALAFSGFSFTQEATPEKPRNMLMIFGKYDEYRARMTGVKDFERDFLGSPRAAATIPDPAPRFGVTYGDFGKGTARRVYMPRTSHILESHDRGSVAEAVMWMRSALGPDLALWIAPENQIWELKEWATLAAMLACLASLLPLAQLLLGMKAFARAAGAPCEGSAEPRGRRRLFALNFVLSWLYLPLVLGLFAVHLYLVRIDKVFPLMMANGIVFWFLVLGTIGLLGFLRSLGKGGPGKESVALGPGTVQGLGLGAALFLFAVLAEFLIELGFKTDFRFVFPFASDLTPARMPLVLLYLPPLFVGFLSNGVLVHVRLRRGDAGRGWAGFLRSWLYGWFVLAAPLLSIILVQYVPVIAGGTPAFVGPGASLVGFVLALFPVLLKLLVATGLSQFLYERTGRLWAGALVSAALVAWMFASSQVIAPIPL